MGTYIHTHTPTYTPGKYTDTYFIHRHHPTTSVFHLTVYLGNFSVSINRSDFIETCLTTASNCFMSNYFMHIHLIFQHPKKKKKKNEDAGVLTYSFSFPSLYSLLFLHLLHISLFVLWEIKEVCLS